MALRVIDHYPDINEIDVPKNASVKVVFNSGIYPQSLTASTFSVNDSSTYTTHPGTLGVEYTDAGICNTIVFQPAINFTTNVKYRVYVFGTPNSVISTDNEQLLDSYTFEFTAGTGVLVDPFPEGIPSGELAVSGISESGIVTLSGTTTSFTVSSIDPQHMEPNVVTQLSGVTITFTGDITTSVSDLSGHITVEETPVLY